ncbi:hypothetical protein N7491_007997 [Penicillium cf. griseofulvum]|uniref:DUF4291 domain-containing protein n=1 Tax=Penicillium cf. griseofulvum TaxID=2972120 RepID=A0A9W9J944_9EURO|nr:hypothetical protein N7472_008975 [Penicillium cf. griseofulvum]KAJ5427555.1 hypothetical protein N7491_007997 [Penicillium cf. griseofulvum]KAJ5431753.1 hypothetical protein N7445_008251 [Penicillium cf. griseofulvum]
MTSNTYRAIRAKQTTSTITVYQAYSPIIADPAIKAQTFVPPFSRDRMTWIKPSFLWMAYRSGWATKARQERVLAIEITREGFEWALRHSCLSHYTPGEEPSQEEWQKKLRASPVRVQWDPERDILLQSLDYRSIQIGLSGEAVGRYLDEWIVSVTDVTATMRKIDGYLKNGDVDAARDCLPEETLYVLPEGLEEKIRMK